ncbi:MAG TPA: Cd(II)/Pb(II)-responsive transcriptional regulator [Burkholderiales bacterium]|nr:Cd(II)/Pb(II)-responsive transcriptional regulator [Burkholderiales bacterium]
METTMRIGELGRATGVEIETIRYYEKAGLLPGPARTQNGYRAYSQAHLEQLAFIRRCRALDMAQDEIRDLLLFKSQPEANCECVNTLLDEHIAHVATRIAELQGLEAQLRSLRAQCKKIRKARDCAILQELAQPDAKPVVKAASHVKGAAGAHRRGK